MIQVVPARAISARSWYNLLGYQCMILILVRGTSARSWSYPSWGTRALSGSYQLRVPVHDPDLTILGLPVHDPDLTILGLPVHDPDLTILGLPVHDPDLPISGYQCMMILLSWSTRSLSGSHQLEVQCTILILPSLVYWCMILILPAQDTSAWSWSSKVWTVGHRSWYDRWRLQQEDVVRIWLKIPTKTGFWPMDKSRFLFLEGGLGG